MKEKKEIVYEEKYVDETKRGKVLALDEESDEEIIPPPQQSMPEFNPEYMQQQDQPNYHQPNYQQFNNHQQTHYHQSDYHQPNFHQPNFQQQEIHDKPNLTRRRKRNSDTFQQETKYFPNHTEKKKNNSGVIILFLILFIGGYLCYHFLFKYKYERATIVNVKWKNKIYPEEYVLVEKSGWSMPPGAQLVSIQNEIYQYHDVVVGVRQECHDEKVPTHKVYSHTETQVFNDGTVKKKDKYKKQFTNRRVCKNVNVVESRPEYRPKYYYKIWEWRPMDTRVTEGSATGRYKTPYWADFKIDNYHRIKSKSSEFQIILKKLNGDITTYKINESQYRKYSSQIGRLCTVKWNYFSLNKIEC